MASSGELGAAVGAAVGACDTNGVGARVAADGARTRGLVPSTCVARRRRKQKRGKNLRELYLGWVPDVCEESLKAIGAHCKKLISMDFDQGFSGHSARSRSRSPPAACTMHWYLDVKNLGANLLFGPNLLFGTWWDTQPRFAREGRKIKRVTTKKKKGRGYYMHSF